MGKETKRKRQFAIRKHLQKREKIEKLKKRYATADAREREKLFAKVLKLSPAYTLELMGTEK
jgi:hypothetical protein